MAGHRLSLQAEAELDDIWRYITEHSSVETADRFIDRLAGAFLMLSMQPHMGRARDELREGYRSFLVGDYLVFYRVEENAEGGSAVLILRVLHGRRDVIRCCLEVPCRGRAPPSAPAAAHLARLGIIPYLRSITPRERRMARDTGALLQGRLGADRLLDAAVAPQSLMKSPPAMRRVRRARAAVCFRLSVLVALSSSCARDEVPNDSSWTGERRELPTGGVLVTNPAVGMWSGEGGWTLEEDLRIGSVDGDGADVFGQIVALEMDGSGRLFAFDGQARELRVFERDGGLLRRFGRQGGGPGEFEHVIGMSLAPDGSMWIVDPTNSRYTILADDGSQRTLRREGAMYRLPWVGGFTTSGDFMDAITVAGSTRVADALVRVDSSGSAIDTVPVPNPELDVPRMGQMELPLPFASRVLRAFDRRGYVWTAVSGEYRLVQTSMTGDTVMIIDREVDSPALTGEQQDSLRRYTQMLAAELGVRVSDGLLPRSAPLLRWMTVDDRGFVWVCRDSAGPCPSLDVFDEAGRFLGEVTLPFRLQGDFKPIVRGDHLLAVAENELGVPMLIRAGIGGR